MVQLHKFILEPKTKLQSDIVPFHGSCKIPNHCKNFYDLMLVAITAPQQFDSI